MVDTVKKVVTNTVAPGLPLSVGGAKDMYANTVGSGKDVWAGTVNTLVKDPLTEGAKSLGLAPKPEGPPQRPGAPKPTMPTMDSEAVAQARRRLAAGFAQRGGRASTILTGGDKLGG